MLAEDAPRYTFIQTILIAIQNKQYSILRCLSEPAWKAESIFVENTSFLYNFFFFLESFTEN